MYVKTKFAYEMLSYLTRKVMASYGNRNGRDERERGRDGKRAVGEKVIVPEYIVIISTHRYSAGILVDG